MQKIKYAIFGPVDCRASFNCEVLHDKRKRVLKEQQNTHVHYTLIHFELLMRPIECISKYILCNLSRKLLQKLENKNNYWLRDGCALRTRSEKGKNYCQAFFMLPLLLLVVIIIIFLIIIAIAASIISYSLSCTKDWPHHENLYVKYIYIVAIGIQNWR